jgi:hypothetical protein
MPHETSYLETAESLTQYGRNEEVVMMGTNEQKEEFLRLIEEINWESFSTEDFSEIIDGFHKAVSNFTTSAQVSRLTRLVGIQSVIANNQNFFFGKETFSEVVEGFFDVLSTHLGPETTKDLITEMTKSAIAKF